MTSDIQSIMVKKRSEVIKIIENYENLNDWHHAKEDEHTKIFWRKSCEWHGTVFKIVCEIPASPHIVRRYVCPRIKNGPRTKWDSAIINLESIEKINELTDILYFATPSHAAGLISERDFVELVFHYDTDSFLSSMSVSIEHDKFPHKNHSVRARNYPSAMICHRHEKDKNRTTLHGYVQLNPSGSYFIKKMSDAAIPSIMLNFTKELRTAIHNNHTPSKQKKPYDSEVIEENVKDLN